MGRSDLTPREKYLLLVHSDIEKSKTGKSVLTEADKEALVNWRAKNNDEAREWNRLNAGWQLSGKMNIMAELYYKDAQVSYLAQLPIILGLLYYPADRQAGISVDTLKRIKKVTIDEAVEITQKQKKVKLEEGLDFDYAVYQFAFELLSEEDRTRLRELYEDIEFDHQYLDQEEIIAHLYGGKKELSDEAKEKLAELVAEQSYNRFAKEYQLFHYFACIPLVEVARKFLKSHGVEIEGKPASKNQESDDEDENTYEAVEKAMRKYADEHHTNIKAMLREGLLRWLDQDLIGDYTPLAVSDNADLLKRWFASKVKARRILRKHIASGELAFRDRSEAEGRKEKLWSKNLYDSEFATAQALLEAYDLEPNVKGELDEKRAFETFSDKVITGESLYAFSGSYEFVKDFKKRADTYDPNLGLVYAASDPEHKGEHLDQELLICDTTGGGEPAAFSRYGMSVAMLSGITKSQTLFEEFKKDGKPFLRFKDDRTAEIFADRRQAIIDGYAALLGFERVFKTLTPIYETDMTDNVVNKQTALRENIDNYNKAVRIATNTDDESAKTKKNWILRQREPTPFENNPLIDVSSIEPDPKIIEEYEAKIKEVFPDASLS